MAFDVIKGNKFSSVKYDDVQAEEVLLSNGRCIFVDSDKIVHHAVSARISYGFSYSNRSLFRESVCDKIYLPNYLKDDKTDVSENGIDEHIYKDDIILYLVSWDFRRFVNSKMAINYNDFIDDKVDVCIYDEYFDGCTNGYICYNGVNYSVVENQRIRSIDLNDFLRDNWNPKSVVSDSREYLKKLNKVMRDGK